MAERRPLGAAIVLTPEKQAFIQSGVQGAAVAPEPPLGSVPVVEPLPRASSPAEPTPPPAPRAVRRSSPRQATLHDDAESAHASEPKPLYGTVLVPLTTRLQPRTAEALRRACLEQKLAGRTPNSQQEIVERAVAQWLHQHHFLE